MKMKIFLILSLFIARGSSLTCDPASNEVKVTVKLADPSEFDDYDQYLFKGLVAYSLQKYCGTTTCKPSSLEETDTVNVHISNKTDRFAMCVAVDDCTIDTLTKAIKQSKPQFNGALELSDTVLLVDGIPPTLKPQTIPDFPTWLIPFIVFICLTVIAAIAIIAYTVHQTKKRKKRMLSSSSDDDDDEDSDHIYENPGAATQL
ncbi:collectrin-like [Clavelina lepadiformis]|uniref:collectrin-like n=1 Tax=Clavelina lepadiformis TaxID=159417 RepID=UPI0040435D00